MNVRFSPRAARDLDSIAAYVSQHSPQGAERLSSAILRTIERLREHPRLGRFNNEGVFQLVVPRTAYVIYYDVEEEMDAIRIVTVRHAARNRPPFL